MKHAAIRHKPPSGEDTRLRSGTTLPPDILEAASRRVGWAALILAGSWLIGLLAKEMAIFHGGDLQGFDLPPGLKIALTAVVAILSLGLFWLSRTNKLSPTRLFDLGLAFGVIGSFLLSFWELWTGFHVESFVLQRGVSWVCVWMMTFPLLMPASARKTAIALGASAISAHFVLALALVDGAPMPSIPVRMWLFLPNLVCGLIAFTVSRIIYRLGAEVGEAREMGSYRLVERLGEGGMGEVWKAEHRMLARPAAIKLILPEAMGVSGPKGIQTLQARFEREAQATASLQSPHTIGLYDFGVTEDGVFYYVMELLEGMDLKTLVNRFGPVPPERAVYLIKQACRSLAEAHHAGLIHRDIKPANLYTCRLGLEPDFVKVLDFGLVKARDGQIFDGDQELTQAKSTSGTPAYMAPEIATGDKGVDGRADLYALGCVAYWLVTGELVFEGATAMKVVLHHVQTPPVPPSERTELVIPPELDRVILTCLEKDPARRPQTGAELIEMLEAVGTDGIWDRACATRWWDTNLPRGERLPRAEPSAEPLADTLL